MTKRRPVRPEVSKEEPQPALDLVKCPAVGCGGTMPISSLVCGRCWTLLPPRTQQALSTTAAAARVRATIQFRRLLAQGKKPEEIWL